MERQIRILMLEDEASDAELVRIELRKSALNHTLKWAQDKGAFIEALDVFIPDIILADYSLPGFDGMSALEMARKRYPEIPVIMVSGAIGEERAIEVLKNGATDYVMKGRLSRLVPVVQRALQESQQLIEKKNALEALRKSEEALTISHDDLEKRVQERTAKLVMANKKLNAEITKRERIEKALHRASLYARSLIETSLDPLIMVSHKGQIMDVNKAMEIATGLDRNHLIGSDFAPYFTEPENAEEGYRNVLSHGLIRDYPLTIRHTSGRTTDVLYNATVYKNEAGEVQGVFAAARDFTEHNRMDRELHSLHEALERRAAQLQSLASELTLTEQRERRRLAQILHDHLQQLLYAARLSVTALKRRACDSDLQKMIQHLDELLGQCIDESRSVTMELSTPVLYDAGLAAALEWLARQMQVNYGLEVEVQADLKADPQAEDMKVLLFQSVRELLFNVVKHSGDQNAAVKMNLTPDEQIRIDVIDNGAGFDAECLNTSGDNESGFGLFSIRERLEQMGGRLEVDSAKGKGARVSIFAPFLWREPSSEHEIPPQLPAESAIASPPALQSIYTMTRKIRVILADDHNILRKGLVGVLKQEPDIEVVAEASDGEMVIELSKNLNPDVILMDVTMPKVDGIEATRRITAAQTGVKVIGFSAHKEEDMAQALYKAGAAAYLSKDEPAECLIAAIRNVWFDDGHPSNRPVNGHT